MLKNVLWTLSVPLVYSDIVLSMWPLTIATVIRKQRSLPESTLDLRCRVK